MFFSATNLSKKDRKTLMKIAKDTGSLTMAIVLLDSQVCLSRVKKDLDAGVDRSNTTVLNEDTKETVVDRQFKKFKDNYPVSGDFDAIIEYRSDRPISWEDELRPMIKLARGK